MHSTPRGQPPSSAFGMVGPGRRRTPPAYRPALCLGPLLGAALLALAGCGGPVAPPTAEPPLTPTSVPSPTPVPLTADQVANAYFRAWEGRRYERMYDLLSAGTRQAVTREAFVRRYTNIESGIGQTRLAVAAQPAREGPAEGTPQGGGTTSGQPGARVSFTATRTVAIFGELAEPNTLPLVRDPDGWRVAWHPGLIFSGLTADSSVRPTTDTPKRGRILDRGGQPLADNGTLLAIGVVPGQITDEPALLAALSETLQQPPDAIKPKYQGGQPDWFMPIAVRPAADRPALEQALGSVPGISLQDRPARVYPLGAAAAHVTGYVAHPTADDLKRLAERGYDETDWIGRAGVEGSREAELAGRKGGRLAIVGNSSGQVIRTIAEQPAVPGADVTLALDATLQQRASEILGDRAGSAIVLDPRDQGLRALASSPSFDPNRFVLGLSDAEWQVLNGPDRPLLTRPTESAYAPASTFKVVTMSAGLERGGFTTGSTFDCALEWRGLPGVALRNWTQQGTLDLVEALTQSCNPAFYTIGQTLDGVDPAILPTFARGFGLGQPTGLAGLREAAGLVPDPAWKRREKGEAWTTGDSVNLAIGQGYLLVTPLQMANAYAALANGGTLRTPVLVQSITRPDGAEQTFQAQDRRTLPISPATRAAILRGMRRVTSTPQGTASAAFRGETVPVAAKTGSAENEGPDAHAWFIGFMTPDQPTTLGLVMVEGGQAGGTTAAPLARQLLDAAYPRAR